MVSVLAVGIAAQDVAVAPGVFCDTQREMERFVSLFDGDMENAVNSVNIEARNPRACIAGTIAFIRGPEVAISQTWNESFHIVRVIVIGIVTRAGLRRTTPSAAYSIERVPERGA